MKTLKSLKEFEQEVNRLDRNQMQQVSGGYLIGEDPLTGNYCNPILKLSPERATEYKQPIGNTGCVKVSPDTYCDHNNNGTWDKGEPWSANTNEGVIKCPQ